MAWSKEVYYDISTYGQYGEQQREDKLTVSQTGTTGDVVNIHINRWMRITRWVLPEVTYTFSCTGEPVKVTMSGHQWPGEASVRSVDGTIDFPKSWVGKTVTMTRSDVSTKYTFVFDGYGEFKLTITADAKLPVTVNRTSSPKAGKSTGNLANNAAIYSGDVLKLTFTIPTGYKGEVTLNGSAITSGATHTVSANVAVVSTAEPMATLHVWNGNSWDLYLIYVYTGSKWELHQANIYNGSTWDKYY